MGSAPANSAGANPFVFGRPIVNPTIAKRDIGLMLFIIAVCVAVLIESWDLPPGTFEPLGSGPVPQAIAFLIIGLCLIILARAAIALARHRVPQKTAEELEMEAADAASGFHPRPWSATAVLVMSGLYIVVLYLGVLGFGVVSTFFLLIVILFLLGRPPLRAFAAWVTSFDRAHLPSAMPVFIAIGISVAMGFGCEFVFTKIFYVDLPTG